MSNHRIFALIYLITVIISIFYLAFSAFLFFDAYTFPRKISITVDSFSIIPQGQDIVVKTFFLIQNQFRLEAKIFYLKQEIYKYSNYKGLLGEGLRSGRTSTPNRYIVSLPPFSNYTFNMEILIKNFTSVEHYTLYSVVYVGIEDVPLLNYFILKEYLVLET